MMHHLNILWKFSRPHTIIGSIFSITTLYVLACEGKNMGEHIGLLTATLIAGLSCNVFIVGINQIVDVDVDVINKPYLPIAAGSLSLPSAIKMVIVAIVLSMAVAFSVSWFLGLLISVITIIGILYSVPPIQLKKHHLPAALCITLVRGLLVNIGMFVHFRYSIFHVEITTTLPSFIWPLTNFMMAFSIAIAWFKDLPDTDGDLQYHFKTLPLLYSKKTAFIAGSTLIIIAYVYSIVWSYLNNYQFLLYGCTFFLLLFLLHLTTIHLTNTAKLKRFYLRFWFFFFAMYLLFMTWFLV